MPLIRRCDGRRTQVDAYWADHLVHTEAFPSARASAAYLESRFAEYPQYAEFFDLWGDHTGQVVLEFGCGPGHDLTGFVLHSGARRVIGMDVSMKALTISAHRLSLHRVNPLRVELIQVRDAEPVIPLRDESVDYVHCSGVLHHTSDPVAILREFARVLKPGGTAAIMVYNRDSIYFHLGLAYARMLLNGDCQGMDVDTAFGRISDGPECPISIAYRPDDWLELCRSAGFDAEFLGGYLSVNELSVLEFWGMKALLDDRLASEHREFLSEIRWDDAGYPRYRGRHAGFGGSYRLRKT
jgi:SAM-dependent methyltransferase